MTRWVAAMAVLLAGASALVGDEPGRFVGEWKTTLGPVRLEPSGDGLTGKVIVFNLPISGKMTDQGLALGYDEGQVHVDATWQLDPSGNAFQGTFQASNGNRGVWNGWRPDPKAAEGEPADFSGLWLTDLGLMELARDGSKVKGRYALRGTSSLEGTVKGRHLDFRVRAFRTGPGWFDLGKDGTTFNGAGGTDGMPAWYGWKGRKAPEYVRHVPLVAGQVVDGSTDGLLTYSVRAPEGYAAGDPKKKWPVVLLLHGSNMSGRAYVSTFAAAWPDLARDFLLLGVNGETPSNLSADAPAFNYTYVNHVGRSTFRGFPGTDRESPALVREAMNELRRVYPVRHYLVGGHSQGGYLAYSLLMNSPEAVAGAFPVSAEVIFQCEPSAFVDERLKAAQRAVPLAIVHGKTDPLVPFASASSATGLFLDAGWPAVRLFDDPSAGHRFARLPVGRAVRWLEVLASDDPVALLDFAERRLNESGYRDAVAAVRRARGLHPDPETRARLDRLVKTIDAEAAPKAATYLEAIRAAKDSSWVDDFLAFRDEFEHADAASDVMTAFNALRARQDAPARKAMSEARTLFQQGRRDDGNGKLKQVIETYPASSSYRLARTWLAGRQ